MDFFLSYKKGIWKAEPPCSLAKLKGPLVSSTLFTGESIEILTKTLAKVAGTLKVVLRVLVGGGDTLKPKVPPAARRGSVVQLSQIHLDTHVIFKDL
ncbi:hypothetical protein LguiA_034608 [Lonicera macranthoides]